ERSRLLSVAKFEAALHEANLRRAVVDPVVEPSGIRTAMGEHHNHSAIQCGVVAFACPHPHLASVGWIAKNDLGSPILNEAVLLLCEKSRALGVGWCRACVESECELFVEEPKKLEWR